MGLTLERATEISDRLRALREARGLTKKALAESAGICIGAYNHYEKGDRCMPVYALDRLCSALSTTPNDLMGYEDNPKRE